MRYVAYLERGLHVGSGVVEGACKNLGTRMKRPGSRWSVTGANAVLAILCCFMTNRWADFLRWRAERAATA